MFLLTKVNLPWVTFKPLVLCKASRSTRASEADPSHPGNTYKNLMLASHTPRTLVLIRPFLFLNLLRTSAGTVRSTNVPSKAPTAFYTILPQA